MVEAAGSTERYVYVYQTTCHCNTLHTIIKKWQLQTKLYITSAIYTGTHRQQRKKSHFGSEVHPPLTQISNTAIYALCLHKRTLYF